jgi:hypothetical protein
MDQDPNPEAPKHPILRILSKIVIGATAIFFWFGDRALREFWHFSFGASVMIWAGVLTAIIVGAIFISHFLES